MPLLIGERAQTRGARMPGPGSDLRELRRARVVRSGSGAAAGGTAWSPPAVSARPGGSHNFGFPDFGNFPENCKPGRWMEAKGFHAAARRRLHLGVAGTRTRDS